MNEMGKLQEELQSILNTRTCEMINLTTEVIQGLPSNTLFVTMVYAIDKP